MARPTYDELQQTVADMDKEIKELNEKISKADNAYELSSLVMQVQDLEERQWLTIGYIEDKINKGRQ